MTSITVLKSHIPIGSVKPDGSVLPSEEFVRFLFDLMRRVGGTSATDNTALQAAIDQAELDIDALVLDMEAQQVLPEAAQFVPVEVADGRLSAVEAELAALRVQVQGLLQGVTA